MEVQLNNGLTLKLADDGRRLLASFRPAGSRGEIDLATLSGDLAQHFPGLFIFDQLLTEVIKKVRADEAFEMAVGEVRDSEVQVVLDASKMAAYLTIFPPCGGAPATREQVDRAIEQAGVVFGVKDEVIAQAIEAGHADSVVVAQGRQPLHGEDGRLESLIASMRERRPLVDQSGQTDYRDLGEILVVRAGEALARLIPATPGEPGETVLGQVIPPTPGESLVFGPGLTGVEPDPGDPDVLRATITGQPVQVKHGVIVEPTYTVSKVDLSTGNIIFDGTVNVQGDVQAGMMIRATGDIHVVGTVEAATQGEATLEAGGCIVIKGGVIGRLDSGDSVNHVSRIQCKGSFSAHFVQKAEIFSEDSIYIDEMAMQSKLTATNQIVVGKDGSGKGQIFGGITQAILLVKAKILGAPSLIRTVVEAGVHPGMHDRLRQLAHEQTDWEKKLNDVEKVLAFAKQNPAKLPPEMLRQAQKTWEGAQAHIAGLREEHEVLFEQIQRADQARVIVEKNLYEGVEVQLGGSRFKALDERRGGVFCLREGELKFDALPR